MSFTFISEKYKKPKNYITNNTKIKKYKESMHKKSKSAIPIEDIIDPIINSDRNNVTNKTIDYTNEDYLYSRNTKTSRNNSSQNVIYGSRNNIYTIQETQNSLNKNKTNLVIRSPKSLLLKPKFRNEHMTLTERFATNFIKTLSPIKKESTQTEGNSNIFLTNFNLSTNHSTSILPPIKTNKNEFKELSLDINTEYNPIKPNISKVNYNFKQALYKKNRKNNFNNINAFTLNLNSHLSRISHNYGKLSSMAKFSTSEETKEIFKNMENVYDYKVKKLNLDKSPHKNMLKPLRKFKDDIMDILSQNLFDLKNHE